MSLYIFISWGSYDSEIEKGAETNIAIWIGEMRLDLRRVYFPAMRLGQRTLVKTPLLHPMGSYGISRAHRQQSTLNQPRTDPVYPNDHRSRKKLPRTGHRGIRIYCGTTNWRRR